jgi:hypothetical protein
LQGLENNSMKGRINKSLTNANPNIPLLIINAKTANITQEKLKAFADTLEHIFTFSHFDYVRARAFNARLLARSLFASGRS